MRSMSARAAKPPPAAGVRWRSVQGGLALFAVAWAVLTFVAASSRLWAMFASPTRGGGDAELAAAVTVVLVGLVYQLVYSVLSLLLAIAAVRVTRAPTTSGAVTPALVAAVSFGGLAAVVLTLVSASTTPVEARQLSEAAISRFWLVAIGLRALAVAAMGLCFVRLARRLEHPFAPGLLGGAGALLAVDTAAALYGVLAPGALDRSVVARLALVGVQVAFAVLLGSGAVRLRRLVVPRAEREARREARRATTEEQEPPAPEREAAPVTPSSVEPDISPAARLVACALAGLGAAALPLWDLLDPRMRFEIEGPSPTVSGGLALAGVLLALVLHQALGNDAYRARLLLAASAMLGVAYAAMTLYTTALQRSHLVDRFPVCESGEAPGDSLTRPLLSVIEGPRLESGAPCSRAGERRAHHLEDHPAGSFQDGVVQMARRFAGDRNRFFGGTGLVLIAFLLSGVLVFRAAVESEGQADEDPLNGETDEGQVRE